jgi:hypothetical protein
VDGDDAAGFSADELHHRVGGQDQVGLTALGEPDRRVLRRRRIGSHDVVEAVDEIARHDPHVLALPAAVVADRHELRAPGVGVVRRAQVDDDSRRSDR